MKNSDIELIAAAVTALANLGYGFRLEEVHDGSSEDPIGYTFTTSSSVVGKPAIQFTIYTGEYAEAHPDQKLLFVQTYDDWGFLVQELKKLLNPDPESEE